MFNQAARSAGAGGDWKYETPAKLVGRCLQEPQGANTAKRLLAVVGQYHVRTSLGDEAGG